MVAIFPAFLLACYSPLSPERAAPIGSVELVGRWSSVGDLSELLLLPDGKAMFVRGTSPVWLHNQCESHGEEVSYGKWLFNQNLLLEFNVRYAPVDGLIALNSVGRADCDGYEPELQLRSQDSYAVTVEHCARSSRLCLIFRDVMYEIDSPAPPMPQAWILNVSEATEDIQRRVDRRHGGDRSSQPK